MNGINLPRLPSRELLDCWIPGSFVGFLCHWSSGGRAGNCTSKALPVVGAWGCHAFGAVGLCHVLGQRGACEARSLWRRMKPRCKNNRKGNKTPCYTIQNSHQKRFKTWFRLRLRLYTNHTIYSIYFSVSLHYLHQHTEFSALVLLHGNCMLLGWLSGCCGGRGWCGCTTSGGAGAGPSGGAQGVAWVRELLGHELPDPIPWGVFRLWNFLDFRLQEFQWWWGGFSVFPFFLTKEVSGAIQFSCAFALRHQGGTNRSVMGKLNRAETSGSAAAWTFTQLS